MLVGLVLLAAVLITEIVLWLRWHQAYFTFGLPIFIRRADRCRRLDDIPLEDVQRRSATAAAPPFAFRRITPDAIAFREGGVGMVHYAPLMRGVIVPDTAQPCVKVVGYVNWTWVALTLILLIGLRREIRFVAPYLGAALAILYFIQAMRFYYVANSLQPRP